MATDAFQEWVAKGLLKKGKSKKGLAEKLGVHQSQVTRILAGGRRIQAGEVPLIAEYLEAPPPSGSVPLPDQTGQQIISGEEPPERPEPNAEISGPLAISRRRELPIFGKSAGGSGEDGKFHINSDRIGSFLAPAGLEHVADAYGVYVHGESMEPRYFAGELVAVNPHAPPRRGDFVVVQITDHEADEYDYREIAAFVKRFVSRSDKELVLEQFNPPKKLRFPNRRVLKVHKIVGLDGR